MTDRLEKGIRAVRCLSAERQDIAGDLLLAIAASVPSSSLTPEQCEDVKRAAAEADRGDFATKDEVRRLWRKTRQPKP